MSVANKLIGKTLSNRYEILRPLGEGGMGKVYLAKDKRFGKQVVVKVPTMEAGDKNFKDRFMREIASLATLEHPHIVTTVDWGEIEGIPFLVLRYLGGGSLRNRITDAQGFYKPMPLEGLSQWLPQIASALDFIHTKNWVHRDLKPDNILFDEAGNPYLADFGIAKALEGAPMGVKTTMGAFIGTPQYMAPEMHLGKGIGPKADQFGLAVLVYEALAGKIPFSGVTPTAIFVEVMQGKATPIHELVPGIPLAKSNALMKGITKEPKDRYGSCVEFANAVVGSMLARGSFLVSNEIPSKPEIAGTRIETPLPIPLAVPVSIPLEIPRTRIETPSKPEIAGTRIETPLPMPLTVPVSTSLEILGTRIETPSKPEIEGTRIETPPPIPLEDPMSIPLKILGTKIDDPSNPNIEETSIETPPAIPLEITDSIIKEMPEQLNNAEETEMESAKSDLKEFNYDSNLYSDLALTPEDYLTESGQLLAQLCKELIEKEKVSKGWWIKASHFFKKHDVSQILGGKALLEKMEEINKLGRVSKEISADVVQLAIRILKEKNLLVESEIENLIKDELAEEQIIDKVVKNPPSKILLTQPISLGQYSVIAFVALLCLLFLIFGRNFNWEQGEEKNSTEAKKIQPTEEEQKNQEEEAKAEQMKRANLKQQEEDTARQMELVKLKQQEEAKAKQMELVKLAFEKEMVLIPAGKFVMGSPDSEKKRNDDETQHEVTLTKPYYMGKYEVTQEQWESVMGDNLSSRTKGAKLPVTDISWEDCQEFIKKLNAKTNGGYRLPTEAEWEYACRAGTSTAYSFGDGLRKNDANIGGDSIKVVGSYNPNAFGLYDMHGNVWEWCEDWKEDYPAGSVMDPRGPEAGTCRVLRGGSFVNYESSARSSCRLIGLTSTLQYYSLGFRLAKTLNSEDLLKFKQEEEAKLRQLELVKLKQEVEAKFAAIEKEMILIPAGKFMMGSPLTEHNRSAIEIPHEVTIPKPFYIGKYEVTQEQWESVMGNNPSIRTKGGKLPVTNVSSEDCKEFIKKLNENTKGSFRLPTEAEWEYACKGGTKTAYSYGDGITKIDVNYNGSIKPVGNYKPNAFGLYDMHGNVWEWCNDFYESYTTADVIDPKGPATGTCRVLRGGSFLFHESESRSAYRLNFLSTERNNDCGFRLARDLLFELVAPFPAAKAKEVQKQLGISLQKEVEEKESLGDKLDLEMVLVPAGTFNMGILNKSLIVIISKPLYMGKYEITQEQWQTVMGSNPSSVKGAKLPATNVSWEDCQEFIKKLNAKTNGGYRLPTEAEWEYACRAGAATEQLLDSISKNEENYKTIKAVGSYHPNAFGIYDMHGNVWEWCNDFYSILQGGVEKDPKGPTVGNEHVLRGGSFYLNASEARSSKRLNYSPTVRENYTGFRLARTADTKSAVAVPKPNLTEVKPESGNRLVAPFTETKAKEVQKVAAKNLQKKVEEKDDLGKGIKLDLVFIPEGKFRMGSPASEKGRNNNETQHEVILTKPYYMGKHEVTQEQWEIVMGDNKSEKTNKSRLPVTDVSWNDCQEFIKKLNAKTNGGYRLPTEAEWEYACRAGTSSAYSYGESITKNDANYYDGSNTNTKEVCSFKPNAFGLYDMHGNVWEWCEDWFGAYPAKLVTDPKGLAQGESRVLRGGSFFDNGSAARSSDRFYKMPTTRVNYLGFRLAKDP